MIGVRILLFYSKTAAAIACCAMIKETKRVGGQARGVYKFR